MIIFKNKGLLEPKAFQVFGLSSKDQSKIGRFGTGMKYAIATILRGGGNITILSGEASFEFASSPVTFRGTEHDAILCNGSELGYTTSLGKDWKPWMAFRELYSNVLDENGSMDFHEAFEVDNALLNENETTIIIDWNSFDAIYFSFEEHFIGQDEAPKADLRNLQVFDGESKFIFYKGIAVHELKEPAAFRYNITDYVSLTEDRTAKYPWMLNQYIAASLILCEDEEIAATVTSSSRSYEKSLDFFEEISDDEEPSLCFIGAAAKNGSNCNPTAAHLVEVFAPPDITKQATVISPAQPGGKCLLSSLRVLRELGEDVSTPSWALIPDLKITSDYIIKNNIVMISPHCFENQSRMDEAVFSAYNEYRKGGWIFKKLRKMSEESPIA